MPRCYFWGHKSYELSDVVRSEDYIGALGRPLYGKIDIKIIDDNNNEIDSSADHPGRMAIKGDMQMEGYWNNNDETAKVLVNGWLITGDMAYIKDGYVFMLGRADNIINVGGEKVSPIEVENITGQYPRIKECACIGVPDPNGILGQVPALYIVADNSVKEDEIKTYLAGKLEKYKIPTIYQFIEKLPRNRMQKVDYKEIKKMYKNYGKKDLMNDSYHYV